MRWGRIIVKTIFIISTFALPLYGTWDNYFDEEKRADSKPIKSGVYEVQAFVVNNDTIPDMAGDTLRWKDMIFEKDKYGSIGTADTLFRQRYKRAYFNYVPDTIKHTLGIKKFGSDSTFLFTMRYEQPDVNTVKLWTKFKKDSLHIVLVKSKHHYQLTERQFHWLSEANR